jgi:hypothetical protein
MQHPTPRCLSVAAGLALAACAAPALAQAQLDTSNPYYFGANAGLTYVSNVFHQNSGANHDEVLSTGLLGGIDTRFGREHLRADASVGYSRYRNNSQLDNLGYTGSLALDWSTVERISGTISVGGSRQLADYNISPDLTPVYAKNTVTTSFIDAATRIGLVTRWSLDTDVSYRRYRYSAPEYASLNYQQVAYSAGPSYQANPDLRIGVDIRRTNGTYPTYFPIADPAHPLPSDPLHLAGYDPNHFSRDDYDLTVRWRVGGASVLDGRVSHGSYAHADSAGQTVSGFSGALTWTWDPTGKLSVVSSYIHDTGLNAYLFTGAGLTYGTSQNTLTDTLQSNATYRLTGKVNLLAGLTYARTRRENAVVLNTFNNAANSHDNFSALSLGVNWQYSRGISVACQAAHQVRNSTVTSYTYDADSIGCNAQILFY